MMGWMVETRSALGLVLVVSLAGCEGTNAFDFLKPGDEADAPAEASAPRDGETRDVEAPEIFSEAEAGLWDGRPSLGGVWVAYPDVPEPERVVIRNVENGSSVIGALFRRERDNPGPRFQISSDAAEALNILAGAPAQIEVIALKRETVAPPPETDAETEPMAEAVDPTALAAAAIAEAELSETEAPAPALPTPTSQTAALDRPYIQIGIFNVAANAEATEAQLRGAGLAAQTFTQESQGRTFYRVIVGPSQSESARAAALDTAKSLGFSDAYFVTN